MALPYKVVKTSDHDEWLSLRMQGIGGSDVAAIMGLSRYRSPLEVWLEKTGRKASRDLSDNEAVYWGVKLEHDVRDEFAKRHPELKVDGPFETLVSVERPWAHANLDGVVTDKGGNKGVLEIKTVGKDRGSDWADGVPDYYLTQVTHYLSVTGWTYAWVAALIGGQHYVEYRVERDDGDVKAVERAVDTFWNDFVVADAMPEIVGGDGERHALLDMYPLSDNREQQVTDPEAMRLLDQLAWDYRKACDDESMVQARKSEMANKMRAIIGESKSVRTDTHRVTWLRGETTRLDVKALKEMLPDVYDEFVRIVPRDGGIRVKELA